MVRLIFFVIIIIFNPLFYIHAQELNNLEKIYFNFLDLNNDNYISYEEINQAISLVFQLIDKDQDTKITVHEGWGNDEDEIKIYNYLTYLKLK